MFWELIQTNAELVGISPAILTSSSETSWNQLRGRANDILDQLRSIDFDRCGLLFSAERTPLAAVAALDRLKKDVFLIDPEASSDQILQIAKDFQLQACYSAQPNGDLTCCEFNPAKSTNEDLTQSTVTILTSGTTGNPKAARHTWKSLMRPVRKQTTPDPKRWFLSYRPHLYAGLQVLLQAFVNQSPIVVSNSSSNSTEPIETLNGCQVQCISGTPSFFRKLFLSHDVDLLREIPLEQITLGGELVDQQILDLLRRAFPMARVAHIYATTELGRCFSVTDGLSGFPSSLLHNSTNDVRMKVEDGLLWVRSQNAMTTYDRLVEASNQLRTTKDGWTCTGDLVEISGERVHFVGRESDLINVGGNKVNPIVVENAIREVENVMDVRVYGMDSTIAGQLVACDIVAPQETAEETKQEVLKHCLTVLDRFHRPRIVRIVDEIELSTAGKKQR